jgi:hypothetical protein
LRSSKPASGSDRQKHHYLLKAELNTSFSASLAYFSIPAQTNELLTDIITAVEASILDISVIAKHKKHYLIQNRRI